jgi:mannose-6-phosphate isomerase
LKFCAQPYRLINKIQHYEWGTKDDNAFIPHLLGIEPIKNMPYAELWIGAHPKSSSEIEIDETKYSLREVIDKFPIECLGKKVALRFNNQLPFLLKVLSAARALSIQTHPNKTQAIKLHQLNPVEYPDDNQKPEVAIALDSLTAIAGFKPVNEIIDNLNGYPELSELVDNDLIQKVLFAGSNEHIEKSIRDLYAIMMKGADDIEKLSKCISRIKKRLKNQQYLSEIENQFLSQHIIYGNDVGLLSFLFLNLVELKQWQSIYTGPGIPHAYIKGNIIECMANSDNVVRAGLTNKFKDIDTLLQILDYTFDKFHVMNEEKSENYIYRTEAAEFEISSFSAEGEQNRIFYTCQKPSIILVLNGELNLNWNEQGMCEQKKYSKGESVFIPAALHSLELALKKGARYFHVEVPDYKDYR